MKIFLPFLFFLISPTTYGQPEKKHTLTLSGAYGNSQLFAFQNTMEGASSFDAKKYYSVALDYSYTLSAHWQICTGVTYANNKAEEHVMGIPGIGEGQDIPYTLQLISFPVLMKYRFWNYFFLNGGLYLNIDFLDNPLSQTGAGFGAGIGAEYTFKAGLTIFINPYFQWNVLVPFSSRPYYQLENEGVKFGIGYTF